MCAGCEYMNWQFTASSLNFLGMELYGPGVEMVRACIWPPSSPIIDTRGQPNTLNIHKVPYHKRGRVAAHVACLCPASRDPSTCRRSWYAHHFLSCGSSMSESKEQVSDHNNTGSQFISKCFFYLIWHD